MRRTSSVLWLLALACSSIARGERVAARPPSEYRIGSEDVLEIVVWHEPELSRAMPVRPDGFISLPLAGEVEAAGKTPDELRRQLTRAFAPYVKDVSVAVLVREINGARYSVMGEVAHAGTFPLRGSISVAQALATAGGLNEFAGDEVVLLRQKGNGTTERHKLSVKELVRGDAGGALWLVAGDVLYVP
ncbi:MAG TPA: polysaccharide biosynthesis/export family protein [Anaeromyxobacteraceae bacterium]|nr:polysaccharide biosynthesis/export family protein [Anaeromyxobacteraceae bacterium]